MISLLAIAHFYVQCNECGFTSMAIKCSEWQMANATWKWNESMNMSWCHGLWGVIEIWELTWILNLIGSTLILFEILTYNELLCSMGETYSAGRQTNYAFYYTFIFEMIQMFMKRDFSRNLIQWKLTEMYAEKNPRQKILEFWKPKGAMFIMWMIST